MVCLCPHRLSMKHATGGFSQLPSGLLAAATSFATFVCHAHVSGVLLIHEVPPGKVKGSYDHLLLPVAIKFNVGSTVQAAQVRCLAVLARPTLLGRGAA